MGRPLSVGGLHRPAVAQLSDGGGTGVDHGLDGQGHSPEKPGAVAWAAVIWDLRRFVHLGSHAVAHVFPDHGKAVLLHIGLNRRGDVLKALSLPGETDALEEALPGHVDQALGLRGNPSAGECRRAVSMKAPDVRAHVHADDIAFLQDPFSGDAVDDFVVDADAGAGWVAVVMEKGRDRPLLADKPLHRVVDLLGCHAGLYHFPCQGTGSRGNFSTPAHQVDLMGGFQGDHPVISPKRGGSPGYWLPQSAGSPPSSAGPAPRKTP